MVRQFVSRENKCHFLAVSFRGFYEAWLMRYGHLRVGFMSETSRYKLEITTHARLKMDLLFYYAETTFTTKNTNQNRNGSSVSKSL